MTCERNKNIKKRRKKMRSAASSAETTAWTPLIDDSSFSSYGPSTLDKCRSFCRRRKYLLCCAPSSLLVAFLIGVVVYLAHNGAFDHVTRDVRIVNGTVTEPNSHLKFPVNLPKTIDGQDRPQRLTGVFLKVKHVAEIDASMHVFVYGGYVDREEGRRFLASYKNGAPDAHRYPDKYAKLVDTISSGMITYTAEYRMVISTPGNQMHDHWLADLVATWKSLDATPERIEMLKKCFSDWFLNRGFHNHDVVIVEVSSRTQHTSGLYNAERLAPCTDPLFGRGFIIHEFVEDENLIVDLLPTLWNKEYDKEFY